MDLWSVVPFVCGGPIKQGMTRAELLELNGPQINERLCRSGFELQWPAVSALFIDDTLFEVEVSTDLVVPIFGSVRLVGSINKISKLFPDRRELGPLAQGIEIVPGLRICYQHGRAKITSVVVVLSDLDPPIEAFDPVYNFSPEALAARALVEEILAGRKK